MKKLLWVLLSAMACAQTPNASHNVYVVGNAAQPVEARHTETIAQSILNAGPSGTVIIPNDYAGTDCNPVASCNPNNIPVIDLRGFQFGVYQPFAFNNGASINNGSTFNGYTGVGVGQTFSLDASVGNGTFNGTLFANALSTTAPGTGFWDFQVGAAPSAPSANCRGTGLPCDRLYIKNGDILAYKKPDGTEIVPSTNAVSLGGNPVKVQSATNFGDLYSWVTATGQFELGAGIVVPTINARVMVDADPTVGDLGAKAAHAYLNCSSQGCRLDGSGFAAGSAQTAATNFLQRDATDRPFTFEGGPYSLYISHPLVTTRLQHAMVGPTRSGDSSPANSNQNFVIKACNPGALMTVTLSGGGPTTQGIAIVKTSQTGGIGSSSFISSLKVVYGGVGYASPPTVTVNANGTGWTANGVTWTAVLTGSVLTSITKNGGNVDSGAFCIFNGVSIPQFPDQTDTIPLFNGTDGPLPTGRYGAMWVSGACQSTNCSKQLDSVVVAGSGTGYTSTCTATGGGGSGATCTCNVTSGNVTSVTVNNKGSGYTSLPTIACAAGSGQSFTAQLNFANANASFGAHLENLTLDCSGLDNCLNYYSASDQEQAEIRNVHFINSDPAVVGLIGNVGGNIQAINTNFACILFNRSDGTNAGPTHQLIADGQCSPGIYSGANTYGVILEAWNGSNNNMAIEARHFTIQGKPDATQHSMDIKTAWWVDSGAVVTIDHPHCEYFTGWCVDWAPTAGRVAWAGAVTNLDFANLVAGNGAGGLHIGPGATNAAPLFVQGILNQANQNTGNPVVKDDLNGATFNADSTPGNASCKNVQQYVMGKGAICGDGTNPSQTVSTTGSAVWRTGKAAGVNFDDSGSLALAGGAGSFTFTGQYNNAPRCLCTSNTSAGNGCKATATATVLTLAGTGTDTVTWDCKFTQ